MSHIVIDEQQARIISEATGYVEIRDRQGKHLGYVASAFTAEDVAIAQERLASTEPRYTTQQVLEHLGSLEQK